MNRWDCIAAVYLALPFDHALDADDEQAAQRATRYLEAAGLPTSDAFRRLLRQLYDALLSEYLVGRAEPVAAHGPYRCVHPFSGTEYPVEFPEPAVEELCEWLRSLRERYTEPRVRAFALWRLLPDRVARSSAATAQLPADGRLPGLPVWPVLDFCAAILAAACAEKLPETLEGLLTELRLKVHHLPKVQAFLQASRTTRDLWSGSLLSSWYVFRWAYLHALSSGPTAVIAPPLRRNPWFDYWLRHELGITDVPEPELGMRRVSAVPNTAIALCTEPAEETEETDDMDVTKTVRDMVAAHWREHVPAELLEGWDRLAGAQSALLPPLEDSTEYHVRSVSEVPEHRLWGGARFVPAARARTAAREAGQDAARVMRPGWWADLVHLSFRTLTQKPLAFYFTYDPLPPVPPKCTLCGELEQVGPADFDRSRQFWQAVQAAPPLRGIRLNRRDRLCFRDLVRRFGALALEKQLGLELSSYRIPDTATVAARPWLRRACELGYALDPERIWREAGHWSGEWLHWPTRDFDPDEPPCPEDVFATIDQARRDPRLGPPPVYLAVLRADGDGIGEWIQGLRGPTLGELLHATVRDVLRDTPEQSEVLGDQAPVTGPYQSLLSEALSAYGTCCVLPVVQEADGFLVFSGGDDALALLPAITAAGCARQLRQRFSSDFIEADGLRRFGPGSKMTLSCGIALVHHKSSLRMALAAAKNAERQAKALGRDLLVLATCRRSGEASMAACPWSFVETFQRWSAAFGDGASDRWVHQTGRLLEGLTEAGTGALLAGMARELARSDPGTVAAFGGPQQLEAEFSAYRAALAHSATLSEQDIAGQFVALLYTAAFMGRPTVGIAQ